MVAAHHDWRVVGPWYRWKPGQAQVRPTDGRGERPAIQLDVLERQLQSKAGALFCPRVTPKFLEALQRRRDVLRHVSSERMPVAIGEEIET